jgi:iduronate 2-sulfatase
MRKSVSYLPLFVLSFALLGAFLSACNDIDSNSWKKPNVIFVSFDDLRPELGCYGFEEIKTPNLDRLASEGVAFLNNYCQVAVCQPSRASYMTGLRPDSVRSWHLGDHHRGAHPDIVTMPQYFKQFGYHTVSIGKIFHNHVPDSISFDEPDLRPPEYRTADMVDRDAESFHYDSIITSEQIRLRAERIKARPGVKLYGGGWGYGTAVESYDAPDDQFYDGAQTDLALETIARLKDMDEPFYLAMGYYRPHLPFIAPKKYWDLYDRENITPAPNNYIPENAPGFAMNSMYELGSCYDMKGIVQHPVLGTMPDSISRILKHGYYASVSYVDACFGRLMDGLEAMGIADNTIIVIIGDHGWKLGEHGSWGKMTNYEIDTRVPLIIRAEGIKGKGRSSERLTELVDVFPTLCELAGIDVAEYLQGTSMVPLLNDPDREWKTAIFSQFHRRPRVSIDSLRYMAYAIRTERYHYIEWYFWDNENKEPLDYVASELYDHQTDPDENINIAEYPDNAKLLDELSRSLKAGWRAARPD